MGPRTSEEHQVVHDTKMEGIAGSMSPFANLEQGDNNSTYSWGWYEKITKAILIEQVSAIRNTVSAISLLQKYSLH